MAKSPKSSSKRPAQKTAQSAPDGMPSSSPERFNQPGHDFTLQFIVQMQATLGEIGAKVDRLVDDVDSHGKKIDKLNTRMAWAMGALGMISALLLLARAVPWDLIFTNSPS